MNGLSRRICVAERPSYGESSGKPKDARFSDVRQDVTQFVGCVTPSAQNSRCAQTIVSYSL
jgi:hypothetical protein